MFFRASGSNPTFTSKAWRNVIPDLEEVVFKGRHKEFAAFLGRERVGRVTEEIERRLR